MGKPKHVTKCARSPADMPHSVTPWLNALGYRDTFIMVAVLGFAWNASLFVMIRIGPWLRKRSADRYWRDVATARAKGLSH